MANGKIKIVSNMSPELSQRPQISGTIAAATGGTTKHDKLSNRDLPEQHPISAITDLQETLDEKLDKETALPLINEAVKGKAKGLYYDAMKEFAKKPYWYLTSEIDPVTKMGTKTSIISGPYDLGQGGGGGGGVTTVTLKQVDWPSIAVANSETIIKVNWTSVIGEDKEPTGNGTLYLTVNDKQVEIKSNQPQGIVEFEISRYIVSGLNTIQVRVMDAYGTTGITIGTLSTVTLELTSSFNYKVARTGTFKYLYTPYGDVTKIVYFIIDGSEYGRQEVKSTGEQKEFNIGGLTHGSHTLEVYFTANINGQIVKSNTLNYDIIYYIEGNETPIIASEFNEFEQEQYITFNIPYRVYIYNRNTFDIQLLVNDEIIQSLTVDANEQYWEYKNDVPGNYKMQIKCGETIKTFDVHIATSQIQVEPVSEGLLLALDAHERTNQEDPISRKKWEDTAHGISCELANFNWKSDGWLKDANNNTVLRVTGDARVQIPFKPFEEDCKERGKTIELEIATSAIRNYESIIISCLDKQQSDFYTYSTTFVDADTRKKEFDVALDNDKISQKITTIGTHIFTYTLSGWNYNNQIVKLADFGISLSEKLLDETATEDDPMILVGDVIIINYSLLARGFYVTPQIALFRSQQTSLSTQYKEDDHVRLTFVIEPKENYNRIIWMYINGIASGAVQYALNDNFKQKEADIIKIGSNDATIDIYNIRVYDNNLSSRQVVNNWIADTQDASLKAARYYRNNNYNEKDELTINKLPSDLPYIIWDINPLPRYKGDKRLGNVKYVEPMNTARNFESENATYNVQGTSSSVYPVKNIRIKYKQNKDFPNQKLTWYDDNGDTIKKFAITEGGIGDNYFTYKVDYASSEGANNVELVRLYNNASKAINILTPPQKLDSKIRVGIDGYPIVAFHRNEEGKDEFLTKANFNNDKANEDVYGFAEGDESWEITNNSSDLAKFKLPATVENFGGAFEIRYPDEDGYNNMDKLGPMTAWVSSTYKEKATNEELPEPVTYEYENIIWSEDGGFAKTAYRETFTHDTPQYRLSKFKAELGNWFNVDSTIFYYIFTHLYLMIDSRAKNAFPTYFASRTAGDGGDRWYWLPYDMDTAIGINNEGKLVFDYNLEDIDKVDGADVYNGQDSVMWNNLREMFSGEIGEMYSKLRDNNLLSYDVTEKMYEEHQNKWSENIFNEDAKIKYVAPLASGNNYLEMLQGSKAEQRKWWLYNRFRYMDSKYTVGDSKADEIILRAYLEANEDKPSISVVPYADIYATVSYKNGAEGVVSKRARRGELTTLPTPFTKEEKATDQETHIFSASQLRSVGDLSPFKPGLLQVGKAIRLQELKVGDGNLNYENPYLTQLELGKNTLLRLLDVRNCTNLTQSVDASGCTNLEEVYFDGTKITGITLPDGGILKSLHLPETLTALELKNQPLLKDFVLAGTNLLETLWLENIPSTSINSFEMISKMRANSVVRVIGIDDTYDSVEKIKILYNKLDEMSGYDAYGRHTEKAQVTGTIHIDEIYYKDYVELTARYPEIIIDVKDNKIKCVVEFYNEDALFNKQEVYINNAAMDPGVPEKAPTQQYYYTFNSWDNSFDNIVKDIRINAIFDEFIQQYKVTFDLQSTIPAPIEEQTVDYGSKATRPEDPVISGANFLGWFVDKLGTSQFNFEETPIVDNITLYAKWEDVTAPDKVVIERVSYNTFNFELRDNVAITAYAITNSATIPSAEQWVGIQPVSEYNGTYTISSAGDYYVWAKDAAGHTSFGVTYAYTISTTLAAGSTMRITEGNAVLNDFALVGTSVNIHSEVDSHYENAILKINSLSYTFTRVDDRPWIISSNLEIEISCTPKVYTVTFDLGGKGTAVADQHIVYNHLIDRPMNQFNSSTNEIIKDWLTAEGNIWDFRTMTVDKDMQLTAQWIPYSDPSKITIELTDDTTIVDVHYYQSVVGGVEVLWGDTTIEPSISNIYGNTFVTHTYTKPGTYKIEISCKNGSHKLGGGTVDKAVVTPASTIKNIEFAYNLSELSLGCLANATNLVELNLTGYMRNISSYMCQNCTNLETINWPEDSSLLEIGDYAFQGCAKLFGTITLPDTITNINSYAFNNCSSVDEFVLSDNVVSIGDSAFQDCANLKTFNITASLTQLSSGLLSGCTSLTSIDIPNNIINIKSRALDSCTNLSKIIIRNKDVVCEENGWFKFCPKILTAGPIGSGCNIEFAWDTIIPKGAFTNSILDTLPNYTSLTEIILPNTITDIGDSAFANNINLNNITLPENLKAVGQNAFASCRGLVNLIIPSNVQIIGKNAFMRCQGLDTLKIYSANVSIDTLGNKVTNWEDSWFLYGKNTEVSSIYTLEKSKEMFGNYWLYRSEDSEVTYKQL